MRLPVNRNLPLAALILLLAAGNPALAKPKAGPPPTGPQADYPMLLGAPFVVDGVTYTPADTLNYDAVGHAAVDPTALPGVTASHRTLPLPSYVEITALDTGRTILARVERRGPLTGNLLTELSVGAAEQLGIAGQDRAPVRVRRVNPPEVERAALRAGRAATPRMDTPAPLLTVLKRRLSPGSAAAELSRPSLPVAERVEPKRKAPPAAGAVMPPKSGPWQVQVGAFSTAARAANVAREIGGISEQVGKLWRVRVVGLTSAEAAREVLSRVRAAGFRDAVVQRAVVNPSHEAAGNPG